MIEHVEGVNYLSLDDIVYINKVLIETQTPNEPIAVLNQNNLSSSQSRPSTVRYYEQTDDMFRLSAVLIESLIQNHPFANANKRTAMMAGYVFLLLNGYELTAPGDEVVTIAEGLARKDYSVEDLENWLCHWSREYDSRTLCTSRDNQLEDLVVTSHFIRVISCE
ncbi:type II toxin-antitoxin system death-on-curing family toxin [Salmonella enterica]|uniref:Type II toxin-antitoxin system death-on-curing family toxin n=1 Tax=Salmonella enterica I TaxID=59201 RepID=A0A3V2TA70_SALET|nr:type II toxin-antitoxin system death-on-curing family toxin [Salmonella enterica]EAA7317306.1 type II toxin-antitoxin system death-on-curing family toxin [Salmonella enterica subsp. enterica]EBM9970978.1 type II toxin-antitoxin system death-on-curing family toxin [Salmonella enterica subsp. enterica serovar Corvallis]EBS5025750.1 type II toxin-antitoxin system death-on-curing family toxin [Salmonella enterica subsp. enterica serovar Give]EBS5955179.1 type II toxin-antitoxin system death-on-c